MVRSFQKLFLSLCLPTFAFAQTAMPTNSLDPSSLAEQIKQLRQAMIDQQNTVVEQQKQLADQQRQLEQLRQQLHAQPQATSAAPQASPRLMNATLNPSGPAASPAPAVAPQETQQHASPLSVRIGGADFTPGGFIDFASIFRTTNTGNGGGTNFFAIPFSNTVAGHLSEFRLSAQNSRLTLQAHDAFGKNDVTGYLELDFLGNDAASAEITSNSHTLRQRLCFIDFKRDKWEVLGGQAWGWLTPNRAGLSSLTADVFYGMNVDFNYQVGLTWTRAPQFRVVYHPSEKWAVGIALENPQQYGGLGEVTFPASFNAQLAGQLDQGAGSSVPNLHPDIIPKVAYDTLVNGKSLHFEAAGLLTSIRITDLVNGVFVKHIKTGGGIEAAVNLELLKNIHFVSNGFWSDGGGRYIFGMGPDAVVLPNAAGTDLNISLVHSGSGLAGVEACLTPRTTLFGYYGAAYFQRNFGPDTTPAAVPGSFVGFGGPTSANNNRAIQEPSVGWSQTFWKNPQYGALQFITQVAYLSRNPWAFAPGAPKNAHLTMVWLDMRYLIP